MGEKLFEDIENFFTFLDECLNVNLLIAEDRIEKTNDQKKEDEDRNKKSKRKGLFDEILDMHMGLGDPYIMIKEEKKKILEDVEQRIISCKLCELHKERKRAVPGDGSPTARVVFVGEAPGFEEDKKGKPFVGKSGNLLMSKIKEILSLDRSEVYITNVVRCRPPQNRTPERSEIEKCSPYLFEELEIISPQLVVALGAPAAKVLLMKDEKITELRGNFYRRSDYTVFVTFHPAYVLRNPNVMELFNEDFKKIAEFLRST